MPLWINGRRKDLRADTAAYLASKHAVKKEIAINVSPPPENPPWWERLSLRKPKTRKYTDEQLQRVYRG